VSPAKAATAFAVVTAAFAVNVNPASVIESPAAIAAALKVAV
jgi:hypothetical protein